MAVPQQKIRELTFQLLFSRDAGESTDAALVGLMMKELAVTRKTVLQGLERVKAIEAYFPQIDQQLSEVSQSYAFDRIQRIERTILRLGIYELLHDDQVPPVVAISEAMRLARKFGTKESAAFINAILDHIYQGEESDIQLESSAQALEEAERLAEEAAQQEQGNDDEE